MLTVNWANREITIPQDYLNSIGGRRYELDVDQLRKDLKDIEASTDGMPFEDIHRHNTEVFLAGFTLARVVEIINNYTITFEEKPLPYRVICLGANHNLSDVQNINNVSLIVNNSAGLIVKPIGSGLSQDERNELMAIRPAVMTAKFI